MLCENLESLRAGVGYFRAVFFRTRNFFQRNSTRAESSVPKIKDPQKVAYGLERDVPPGCSMQYITKICFFSWFEPMTVKISGLYFYQSTDEPYVRLLHSLTQQSQLYELSSRRTLSLHFKQLKRRELPDNKKCVLQDFTNLHTQALPDVQAVSIENSSGCHFFCSNFF